MTAQLATPDAFVLAKQALGPRASATVAPETGAGGLCVTSTSSAVIVALRPTIPPGWLVFKSRNSVSLPAVQCTCTGAEVIVLPLTTADAVIVSTPWNTPA